MADDGNTTVSCPDCDRNDFKNEHGLKVHRGAKHDYRPELECEWCGDTFEVPAHKTDNRRFCSLDCVGKSNGANQTGEDNHNWKGGLVELECVVCGGVFEVKPNRSHAQFCSKECEGKRISERQQGENNPYWHGGLVELECDTCGETFNVAPSEKDEKRFCSRDCFAESIMGEGHPRWAGGVFPYGPGWNDAKKEAVRERDGYRCQNCGRSQEEHLEKFGRRLTVHHIQKARSFDDPEKRNAMDNLVTLCRRGECHDKWEAMSPLQPDIA